jgi:hypothetical protein
VRARRAANGIAPRASALRRHQKEDDTSLVSELLVDRPAMRLLDVLDDMDCKLRPGVFPLPPTAASCIRVTGQLQSSTNHTRQW